MTIHHQTAEARKLAMRDAESIEMLVTDIGTTDHISAAQDNYDGHKRQYLAGVTGKLGSKGGPGIIIFNTQVHPDDVCKHLLQVALYRHHQLYPSHLTICASITHYRPIDKAALDKCG